MRVAAIKILKRPLDAASFCAGARWEKSGDPPAVPLQGPAPPTGQHQNRVLHSDFLVQGEASTRAHRLRMRQTIRLLHAHRITLFTRANCSLCDHAKAVLSKAWDKRPFDYTEIDVMAPGQKKWKDIYEFDTPVV